MNTVLDDNKKLCLHSGEIIKLTPYIQSFFECENVTFASPATISRCGMIFLEENNKGTNWEIFLESFFLEEEI